LKKPGAVSSLSMLEVILSLYFVALKCGLEPYNLRVENMNLTRADTKAKKFAYAVVVVVFAIGFPLFLLARTAINDVEIGAFALSLALLYIVVVSGFVLLIFNIEGMRIKVKELDEKTKDKLRKFYFLFIIIIVLNIIYSVYRLIIEVAA
jgi:small-conductance mechanosensitive channel